MRKQKITCVIIDDEISSHKILTYHITNFDNLRLVARCYNAFDGMKAIEKHRPHLVFLDVNMPEMTGFEMLSKIPDAGIKVILITASNLGEADLTDPRIIAATYKPVSEDRFARIMKKMS